MTPGQKIEAWRIDYNAHRPCSPRRNLTPSEITSKRQDNGSSETANLQSRVVGKAGRVGGTMDRRAFGLAVLSGGASPAALTQPVPTTCERPAGGLGEQDFRDYIAAFNRSDFDGFSRYYAADVKFEGRGRNFTNRDQVLAFYREVKSRMRETITIMDIIVGDTDMVANIVTELFALRDWPEFVTGPIKKGQTIISENFVWYEMKDARFVHIRSAGYRRS